MTANDPLLEAWSFLCRRFPDRELVVGPAGSYRARDIEQLAEGVRETTAGSAAGRAAIERGRAALAASNGVGFLATVLALRSLGCAVVLVDWQSRNMGRDRVRTALGVEAWFVHDGSSAAPSPDRPASDWLAIEPAGLGSFGEIEGPSGGASPTPFPESTAFIKLTSGSTGQPQGVAVSSAALLADDAALARTMGLTPEERILAAIPMSHSYGLSSVALPALIRGSTLVVPGRGPLAAMKATREHGVSFLPTVPAYVHGLTRASRPPRAPESLRLVITAGAPLAPELAADWRRIYGHPIHVFYGSSETGGITYDREGGAGERGSLGTPIDGVEIELEPLDAGDPSVAPSDLSSRQAALEGVICVRSAAVASTYVPNARDSLENGCFRTADLGRWVDGELELRGRIDSIINVKGKKIHPREIEEILSRHPAVSEVVVVPVVDDVGTSLVRAVVVPRQPASVDERTLRDFCQLELPSHKVPRSIVLLRELPLTERGKIDRLLLSEPTPPLTPGSSSR